MRTWFTSIGCLFVMILLSGCITLRTEPVALSSEEVLERSNHATLGTESLISVVHADIDYEHEEEQVHTQISIESAKDPYHQIQAQLTVSGSIEGEQSFPVDIVADIFWGSESELYIRLDERGTPAQRLFDSEYTTHEWWLAHLQNYHLVLSSSPLLSSVQLITVTKDRGMLQLQDHTVYHYDITLDTIALREHLAVHRKQVVLEEGTDVDPMDVFVESLNANGQVWIDAETFTVRKIVWDVQGVVPETEGQFTFSVEADFLQHNAVAPLSPPRHVKQTTVSDIISRPRALLSRFQFLALLLQ